MIKPDVFIASVLEEISQICADYENRAIDQRRFVESLRTEVNQVKEQIPNGLSILQTKLQQSFVEEQGWTDEDKETLLNLLVSKGHL